MKIAFLNVKSSRKECINKDFMSGYGWAFNAGNSMRARLINFVKKQGESWNGDVFPRGCVATESKYSMGNTFETDFKEIWNGEKYIAGRKELLDQPNNLETICHLCKANGYYTP